MRINEVTSKIKSGMIPYYIKNGTPHMAFMVSSNPDFGGPDPSISKGHVDKNETTLQAAIREMHEEIGIDPKELERVFHVSTKTVSGLDSTYDLVVFGGLLDDKKETNFGWETKEVKWFTPNEINKIRKSHQPLVREFLNKIGY